MSEKHLKIKKIPGKILKELGRFKNRRLSFLSKNRNVISQPTDSHHQYQIIQPYVTNKRGSIKSKARAMIRPPIEPSIKKEYKTSDISNMSDEFIFYRIIGNDLIPRHAKGQSYNNVKFILEHESELPNCKKKWVINRIFDEQEKERIVSILKRHNQDFIEIPFIESEYAKIGWDKIDLPDLELFHTGKTNQKVDEQIKRLMEMHIRRQKNIYAMNNNGARNVAINDGKKYGKWILPFDGNCFFTINGFEKLRQAVVEKPWYKYFIVPMARCEDNMNLLDPDYSPSADEEPQILFRADSLEAFDETVPYGRRPKVNLFWRLGVEGKWDRFRFYKWDPPIPEHSEEAGQFFEAGWVARLDSGRTDLEIGEKSYNERGAVRGSAIIETLDMLDETIMANQLNPDELIYYSVDKIKNIGNSEELHRAVLREHADRALTEGAFSVVQKTTLPPSEDIHDYWHPAPYWWPDPDTSDGLPYIWRDGARIEGTKLYQSGCEQYDRTSLQKMFDNCTILGLAGFVFDEGQYHEHAAKLIKEWFINDHSRMNPHLKYAQVRKGHNQNLGRGTGIIEFKDVYYFLDAVRLLIQMNSLTPDEIAKLKEWFEEYLNWLRYDLAGIRECGANNNHGTFFDVQAASIAAFVKDTSYLAVIKNRAELRLFDQTEPDGSQPHELKRTKPRHYTAFSLSSWTILARLMQPIGVDLWSATDEDGRCLKNVFRWFSESQETYSWPADEVTRFPLERFNPIVADQQNQYPDLSMPSIFQNSESKQIMHPDFGVAPLWVFAKD